MTIHESALISEDAVIGRNVEVGAFTIVLGGTRIGDNSIIEPHCVLGRPVDASAAKPLVLGNNSLIRSHNVFYAGSHFGDGLRTGHQTTVREGTRAGIDLQLGTLNDIQGNCEIGDHVRLHSNVHVGQLTVIESFVWVFPYVVFTNDPHPPSDGFHVGAHIGEYSAIATMTTILPGVSVGARSLIGAHSLVTRDVPPDMIASGSPARIRGPVSDIQLRDDSGPAYPWMRHFHRGYPAEIVAQWKIDYPNQSEPRGSS